MAYKQLKLWFDEELAALLGKKISPLYPKFDTPLFIKKVKKGVGPLELKDRVELMADHLHQLLPESYSEAVEVLMQSLGPENEKETDMFKEFYWVMPIAKFVEKYGLDHLSVSLTAMEEITKRNTSEYTIRPFYEQYPKEVLGQALKWSKNKNFHVRRLASEGLRPRLPWAPKIQDFIDNPNPYIPILENLKSDNKKYVQKSVANSVNDILKDNPDIALSLLTKWAKQNPDKNTKWIIFHALRNLRKKEDPQAKKIMDLYL